MSKVKKEQRSRLTYTQRKSIAGYAFISIWLIGFIVFFIRPFIMAVIFSLNNISFTDFGYDLEFVGADNYHYALMQDPDFIRNMADSFLTILTNVPIVTIISLVVAVLLNENFKGSTFFRGVFFTPVIVATGVVISILKGDAIAQMMMGGDKATSLFQVTDISTLLAQFQIPQKLSDFIINMSNSMFDLLWKCGLQILLFIAALKNIPASVYEASSIEGASKWDNFWKVTIPMISPTILLVIIYSIVDSFTDYYNTLMQIISNAAQQVDYSYSSTMAIIYFAVAMLFIGAVYLVANRFVFYEAE